MATVNQFTYEISQSVSSSFIAGDAVEFSFSASASPQVHRYSQQFVNMYFTNDTGSDSDWNTGNNILWRQVPGFPQFFGVPSDFTQKAFSFIPTGSIQGIKAIISGAMYTQSGFDPDDMAPATLAGIYIDYDDLVLASYQPKTELTDKGLIVFRSPSRYIKADKDGITIKGGRIEATDMVAESLMVHGNIDVYGDFKAFPSPPHSASMVDITADTASAGQLDDYAMGDHTHRLTFSTLNTVVADNPLSTLIVSGTISQSTANQTASFSTLEVRDKIALGDKTTEFPHTLPQIHSYVKDDSQWRQEVSSDAHQTRLSLMQPSQEWIVLGRGNAGVSGSQTNAFQIRDVTADSYPFTILSYNAHGSGDAKQAINYVGFGVENPQHAVQIGDGVSPRSASLAIYKPSDTSGTQHADQIIFYDGTTRMGEIGTQDTTWLRFNDKTNKKLYTNRVFRLDGGIMLDGTPSPDSGTRITLGASTVTSDTASLRIENYAGYVEIGPKNTSWSHFYTDRANYYFNTAGGTGTGIVVDGGLVASYDEDLILRRDHDDTTYNQIVIGDDTLSIKLDNTERLAINGAGQMTYVGDIYHTSGSIVFAKTTDGGQQDRGVYFNTYHTASGQGAQAYIRSLNTHGSEVEIGSDNRIVFTETDNNTERVRFNLNDGSVGIGTTSPDANDATLTVSGSISSSGDIIAHGPISEMAVTVTTAGADAGIQFANSADTANWGIASHGGDGHKLKIDKHWTPGSDTKLTIDTDGNVGIGNSSPSHKLVVGGAISASGDIHGNRALNQHKGLKYFGGLYFTWNGESYGSNKHHSITSVEDNNWSDSLTLNTYDKLMINIDSNNNNNNSYFRIGQHGTGSHDNSIMLDFNDEHDFVLYKTGSNHNGSVAGASFYVDGTTGYVGIGNFVSSSQPPKFFTVEGDISASGNLYLQEHNELIFDQNPITLSGSTRTGIHFDMPNDDFYIWSHQSSSDSATVVFEMTDNPSDRVLWWWNTHPGTQSLDSFPMKMDASAVVINQWYNSIYTDPIDPSQLTYGANNTDFYVVKSGSTNYNDAVIHADVSAGRVGIGADDPSHTLKVSGVPDAYGTEAVIETTFAGEAKVLSVRNNISNNTTDDKVSLQFSPDSRQPNAARIIVGKDNDFLANSDKDSNMQFVVIASNASKEVMRLTHEGFVGIGTTEPGKELDVDGEGTFSSQVYMRSLGVGDVTPNAADAEVRIQPRSNIPNAFKIYKQGSGEAFFVSGSGEVGIGTASPDTKLHIYDTSDVYSRIEASANNLNIGYSLKHPAQEWIVRSEATTNALQIREVGEDHQWMEIRSGSNYTYNADGVPSHRDGKIVIGATNLVGSYTESLVTINEQSANVTQSITSSTALRVNQLLGGPNEVNRYAIHGYTQQAGWSNKNLVGVIGEFECVGTLGVRPNIGVLGIARYSENNGYDHGPENSTLVGVESQVHYSHSRGHHSPGAVYGFKFDGYKASDGGSGVDQSSSIVNNLYELYLGGKTLTGGAKISSSHYGVYQSDSEATNYFAGNVGIGLPFTTSLPTSSLHIRTEKAAYSGSYEQQTASLLTLEHSVGTGDLQKQRAFIDFALTDSNTNSTPQVRIGAEVGRNVQAGSLDREGAGAFVIYTNSGSPDENDTTYLTEKMRVDWQGNVGLGTAQPSAKIHIDVDTEDNQPALLIEKVSDQNETAMIVNHATSATDRGIADFQNSEGSKLYIRGDGNVGIGTNSPSTALYVSGTITTDTGPNNEDAGHYFRRGDVLFGRITCGNSQLQIQSQNDKALTLRDTDDRIFLYGKDGGKVGIGMNPTYQFDVTGSLGTSDEPVARFQSKGGGYLTINDYASGGGETTIGWGASGRISGEGGDFNIQAYAKDIAFYTQSAITTDIATAAMVIDTNGVLGINQYLNVNNVGSDKKIRFSRTGGNTFSIEHDSSRLYFYNETTTSKIFAIKNDGKVGIGTVSPAEELHISGTSDTTVYVNGTTPTFKTHGGNALISSTAYNMVFQADTDGNDAATTDAFKFQAGETTNTIMTMETKGTVGIGTTTPSQLLHIKSGSHTSMLVEADGGSYVAGLGLKNTDQLWKLRCDGGIGDKFIIRNETNTSNPFTIDLDGNVGVGTTAPKAHLHINSGSGGGDGQAFGGKDVDLSTNWGTILTIGLANHESAYVKMTINGNWSNHSGIMFMGEYFISNGNELYNEPGMIIREVENTAGPSSGAGNTDTIRTRLSSSGDFVNIQAMIIDASEGSETTSNSNLNFHIMGEFDTIE